MSGVKSISVSLESLISAFLDGATGDKLCMNLDNQARDVFHHKFVSLKNHVTELLVPCLSTTLNKLVAELAIEESRSPGKPLLSVQSLRVVYTAVELLWQWGIVPTLDTICSEFKLPVPPFPSSLLVQKKTIDYVSTHLSSVTVTLQQFDKLTSTVAAVTSNDTFSGLMLQRNLDRVLFCYLVLSNLEKVGSFSNSSELESQGDITTQAAVSLQGLYEGPFAPVVVSKLRAFTKGPAWLRDASCAILTNILQGPRGVETVLSGYLEGSLDSAYAAALQAHVAKLITTAPAGFSASAKQSYLLSVSEQVKDLLLYGLFKNDKTLMRVCVLMVQRLAVVCPAICSAELLAPLAAPLLSVLPTNKSTTDTINNSGDIDDSDDEIVDIPIRSAYVYEKYLYSSSTGTTGAAGSSAMKQEVVRIKDPAVRVDALCVQSCVEMLHLLLTLCPLHRSLVQILCTLQVDIAMLQLYTIILPYKSTESVRGKVDAQFFETVESFCVNFVKFVGTKMVFRVEHFLYTDIYSAATHREGFNVTSQGLVEVRTMKTIGQNTIRARPVSSISDVLGQVKAPNASGRLESLSGGNSELELALNALQERLRAIVALLLVFEESITARAAQMDVTTTSAPSRGANIKQPNANNNTDIAGATNTYEYLASELFLRSLAGFLHLQVPPLTSDTDNSQNNSDPTNKTNSANDLNAKSGLVTSASVDPALYGAVVLALQEQLPFSALLRDGLQILRLLKSFVEHYANGLSSTPADTISDHLAAAEEPTTGRAATSIVELSTLTQTNSPPSSFNRRPLIEEIVAPGAVATSSSQVASNLTTSTSTKAENEDLITPVLSLLATILHLGQARRSDAEEALIRTLLPPLQTIAFRAPASVSASDENKLQHARKSSEDDENTFEASDENVAQTASDVALMILSRSYQQTYPTAMNDASVAADPPSNAETFLQMVARLQSNEFLFSDSPAMRGYATRILLQHLQRKAQALSTEETTVALNVLLRLLSDQESFVYLNALVALRQLSENSPKVVFQALLEVFAGSEERSQAGARVVNVSSVGVPTLPQARRAMVGEALTMMLQRAQVLKESRPVFRLQIIELLPMLVNVCLAVAQRRVSPSEAAVLDAAVDLQAMRVTATQQEDAGPGPDRARSKMITDASFTSGSAPVVAGTSNEVSLVETGPQVSKSDLELAITVADANILRQSAVSLLAEALILAGPASYRYLDDIMDLALGVLSTEQGHGQSVRAARRAAAYLASRAITLLCESLGVEGLLMGQKSRTFDSFQHNYEELQRAALHDTDEVVKYHASKGLFALQDLYAKMFAIRENTGMMDARVVDMLRVVK